MAGEIIRMGDPTSHGGKVIEGSMADICHGKPIAYMGHQTFCPRCKGNFPIIDGAPTTTFYGKGVALAGMKTACGAVLIATQFTDIVGTGGGSEPSAGAPGRHRSEPVQTGSSSGELTPPTQSNGDVDHDELEQYFVAIDSKGEPINLNYRIDSGQTKLTEAALAGDGATNAFPVDVAVKLVFWKAPT
jgi:uncharacterized Zn-binding protein involved in type VI secretion